MSLQPDASNLFVRAAEFRRLAREAPDEVAAKELLALAAELEMEARLQLALGRHATASAR
jgi:hypothetical protein